MYCKNCGKEIDDKAVICTGCGVSVIEQVDSNALVDKGGFLWGALGCFVPIAGLILFLVWKDTKPKTSKAAGIGAIVGVSCLIAFYVLIFILAFATARMEASYYYY